MYLEFPNALSTLINHCLICILTVIILSPIFPISPIKVTRVIYKGKFTLVPQLSIAWDITSDAKYPNSKIQVFDVGSHPHYYWIFLKLKKFQFTRGGASFFPRGRKLSAKIVLSTFKVDYFCYILKQETGSVHLLDSKKMLIQSSTNSRKPECIKVIFIICNCPYIFNNLMRGGGGHSIQPDDWNWSTWFL